MNDLYPNIFKNLTRNPISIILLDGRKQTMIYDKTTKLSTLFNETCSLCNLDDDNIFGFATLMDDYYAFLNLDTKVSKINFKEISKKSQNNILFQSSFAYYSPFHKPLEQPRRLSQEIKPNGKNKKFFHSISSTKSAPVNSVQDQLTSNKHDTPVIYFRLKSYVFPHCLRDKTTKSLYFLQLLRNVLDYKLKCVDEIYLQLGSFAIQAFYGDYSFILASSFDDRHSLTSSNTESSEYDRSPTLARLTRISTQSFNFTPNEVQSGRYFDLKKFFPLWIIEKYSPEYLFKEIPELHKSLTGMSRVEAEFSYIRMASAQYSNFNMHLFPIRDQKISGFHTMSVKTVPIIGTLKNHNIAVTKSSLWLGLSPAGMEMHEMNQSHYIEHLSTLKWTDIDEVTHKSSRISIHVGCRSLKLNTSTKMQADHLFWLTRHMHMYQTKARLNATCTAEALENAERQKYREKYVYMDLEDLKLHEIQVPMIIDQSETLIFNDANVMPSTVRLPFVNTPAALPRRAPSKARPIKMKNLIKLANSNNELENDSPTASLQGEKHCQYIKKFRPTSQSNNYVPIVNKGINYPEIIKLTNDFPYNPSLYMETTQKPEPDTDDSNNDSGSTLPPIVTEPPRRFVSSNHDRPQQDDLSRYSNSPDLSFNNFLPPREFLELCTSNSHIAKSTSFDVCDMITRQNDVRVPQRHQSDPQISYAQLYRSVPLLVGLCQEFNNTQIISNIKITKMKTKESFVSSAGMKSWKSDVLFNLNFCLDNSEDLDEFSENSILSNDDHISRNNHMNSLPQPGGSFGDLISLSSTESDNDHESVDISSISSFEYNDLKYTKMNLGQATQITII